jgi:hypothetical protein
MLRFLTASALTVAMVASTPAQEAQTSNAETPKLALELNSLKTAETGCLVTFLATNDLGGQLDRAAVEIALFDGAGAIDRIVTLDFKSLSPGKTKVLQFALEGLSCDAVSRVLVNDVSACEGSGIAPESCLAGLVTTARPDIDFGV